MTTIIQTRSSQKEASLQRILDAAAARLREEGLGGAAIASVMRDAGLTHGAFYAHFDNKNDLAIAALRHALKDNRRQWVGSLRAEAWEKRLHRLARRYLIAAHRDQLAQSCALAALASETAHAEAGFRAAYGQELEKSLLGICAGIDAVEGSQTPPPISPEQQEDAMACLALCIGGMTLARAVTDPALSDRLLKACREAAARLGRPTTSDPSPPEGAP